MVSFHELSDGVSSLTAQAVHAGARGSRFLGIVTAEGNQAAVSLKGFVGNPSALSARWRHPCRSYSVLVTNSEGPLRVEVENVRVKNSNGSQWIHDHHSILRKTYLWPNPKGVGTKCDDQTDHQLDEHEHRIRLRHETVCRKKGYKHPRYVSPYKVHLGSENSFHAPIISGDML